MSKLIMVTCLGEGYEGYEDIRMGVNPDHIVLMVPDRKDPSRILVCTSLLKERCHVTREDAMLLGWDDY